RRQLPGGAGEPARAVPDPRGTGAGGDRLVRQRHGANALEIANERYRAGAGSYLAVLENQRALYQIREELAQAETASFVNVIALYKALGWGSGDLAPGAGQLAAGETAGANR
ncbi:TolC family protein, partial [Pseudomonas aeruginosa]